MNTEQLVMADLQPPWQRPIQIVSTKSIRTIKIGIWVYFFLLIFEGALRKWFLPGLATPLLVVRDPLALWLLLMAVNCNVFPVNGYVIGMVAIGLLGIVTGVLVGHGSIPVALFGARTMVLHFPLLFVIGRVFTREDVVKIGKVIVWLAIPMLLLITIQFYSPQSAWVNRGVGGDVTGAGFGGALGFFRPPATFSFTNGNHLFFGLAASFIIYFWFGPERINRLALVVATGCLFVAIPFSISRTLLFEVAITLFFALIANLRKPKYVGRVVLAGMVAMVVLVLLSRTSFFQTATEAFSARFEDASEYEGGLKGTLGDRFLGGMVTALSQSIQQPFFGYGLGLGTNIGSMLLVGDRMFLVAEEEWARTIGELGPLMGLTVILLRLILTATITLKCYRKLRAGDLLPWMLLSFGFFPLAEGGWAQPTSLGFYTLIGGLLLASLRVLPTLTTNWPEREAA